MGFLVFLILVYNLLHVLIIFRVTTTRYLMADSLIPSNLLHFKKNAVDLHRLPCHVIW